VDLALPFHAAKARVVDDFERAYIAGVLEAHGGKVGLAAKHAGLDPKNLSAKAARYGLRKGAAPAPGIPPTRATPAVAPPGRDRTETPIR